MEHNHKQVNNQVVSGLFWKFAERILAQGTSFLISVILARLMMPEDYGIVAIVLVFISIANVFITQGFSQALIQKKDASELDFTTVFYCSLAVSVALYFLLFFSAPYIAAFYENPLLTSVLRVFALRLPLTAYGSVQHAYVSRHMLFKRFFWSTLFGTLLSGIVGIVMAYLGFGVWALVAQYLVNSLVDVLVLGFTIPWHPKWMFSVSAAKSLMGYGWKVLVANLVGTLYSNLRSLLIGKFYSEADLAYYNKGKHFPDLLMTNVATSITSVLFPALSNKNDDLDALKRYTRKSIQATSYVVFPMMAGMFAVAKPMITVFLTEKWIDCVFYTQMVCLYSAMHTVTQTNLQAVNAVGRSDIVLKLEFVKKPINLLLLLAALPFGPKALAVSLPVGSLFSMLVNMQPVRKLIHYGFTEQIKDILPPTVMSILMALLIYPLQNLDLPMLLILTMQIAAGAGIYVLLSVVTKNETFFILLKMLQKITKKSL